MATRNTSIGIDVNPAQTSGFVLVGGNTSAQTLTIGVSTSFTGAAMTFNGTGTATFTMPGTDTLVGIAATQTLTNKTIGASTTGVPALSFASGTAPTSPSAGALWWDGTSLKFYTSATKTFLWADLSNITGTLGVANGGTNISSYSTGSILYASGSTTLTHLAIGSTNGAILMSNGSSAPSWATSIPATITFSNGATISGGTFTLNTNETCSLTITSTAPTSGRSDVDIWNPSGAPTADYYAYYQQMEYGNNQASSFGIAGLRADVITTSGLTSSAIARADSAYLVYNPGGSGTVSQATGVRVAQVASLSGTTTNYMGLRVENNVTSGTITNAAGLYIDTIGGKGGTSGASIYLVSDGTAKTGLSWNTSTSSYTADVGLYRSGSGALTATATAFSATGSFTVGNGLTVTTGGATITAGGLTVSASGITDTLNALATTSTLGFALQNTTASTSGATQQQSPAQDFIAHAWNTTPTAADNTIRYRRELQVTSGTSPSGTLVWKSSVDTGTASFTNQMTLTTGGLLTVANGITSSAGGITDTLNSLGTNSTLGFALQNTTASTSGTTQQQSPALDFVGHAWNTTVTAADNYVRYRRELQVTSGTSPSGTLVWKSSVDTGTASFVNQMTLTTGGLLTVANGLTITAGSFTIGSFTLTLSSSSVLSTNSQTLAMTASMGNFTHAAGTGSSATTHNFVQSGTAQYVLESATAPAALGDMYYASTSSYATMTKLGIGAQGAVMVVATATPTPTWLSPSATAGVALISNGSSANLSFGTVLVAGGGTGQTTFASTNSLVVTGSSSTGAFATVTGASGLLYGTAANTAPTFTTSIGAGITFTAGITVTTSGIADTINNITTTSTQGFALQNTTASTSGATQQQSPGFDLIAHVWNTTVTAADNTVRYRSELQVTSGTAPTGTLVWKSSVDTGTASFTNRMTLTTGGLLTVSNGLTITAGSFTIGSNTFAVSTSSTLSTNSQTLTMSASIGNFTIAAGTGTTATTHNFVQSGTAQYVLESATAPAALGDMYYASTSSYATMTKLGIGVRGAVMVVATATPTPTWLSPSATAGVALISNGSSADLTFGTVLVAGGGTGQTTFASTNSLVVTGSSSTGAFATVTGASGLLYGTAANTAPTFATSIGALITFSAGLTISGAKTTTAAAATGYASINLPSGTTPTSPASGDLWWDGTHLYFYNGSSNVNLLGGGGTVTGTGTNGQVAYWSATTVLTGGSGFTYASNQLTVSGSSGSGIIDTVNALAATSTQGFALQNTTASTSGATQQQSPGFDYIGHVWNTTATAADNYSRFRNELQVTSGTSPTGTLVWKASIDTGTASFTNVMTLTTGGLLTVSNGLTITAGSFTIGSNTLALSSSSTLSTNSQTLAMSASIGNFTIGAGTGTSATTHNFVQSGTTQYVLESATAPAALGDMYYASTSSYATMTKLGIGARGSMLVAATATPTPTWLSPSATAGVAMVSGGTGADLAYGTVLVAGGGTGQTTFASTNSLLLTGSSSTGAFATVTGAAGLLYGTAANTAPTFATSIGTAITFTAGLTVTTNGITNTLNALATTSTLGFAIQNTTASTSGATQQQSPAQDFIGHAWNTTPTAADNYVRMRNELQVTSGTSPSGTFVWKSSVDTGAASFTNVMTLTTLGVLNLSMTSLATTSTQGFALQNVTASTSGATQQQSPGFDLIGHAWNTTIVAADNYVRFRQELQVTSGASPSGTLVWKSSVDTGTVSFTNRMTLTTGGLLTTQGGLTVNGAKTTLAATATGYASLNLPSGTAPTSPASGDLYNDGTIMWLYDGTSAKRLKHQAVIVFCAGFTPAGTGADTAEFEVPYKGDGTTSITWNVRRIHLRVGTVSGSNPAINIEYSTASGNFSATTVGSCAVSSNNEAATTSGFSVSTLSSGNKVRFNVTTLGASTNWTIKLELEEA